jgi:hypothetical protein
MHSVEPWFDPGARPCFDEADLQLNRSGFLSARQARDVVQPPDVFSMYQWLVALRPPPDVQADLADGRVVSVDAWVELALGRPAIRAFPEPIVARSPLDREPWFTVHHGRSWRVPSRIVAHPGPHRLYLLPRSGRFVASEALDSAESGTARLREHMLAIQCMTPSDIAELERGWCPPRLAPPPRFPDVAAILVAMATVVGLALLANGIVKSFEFLHSPGPFKPLAELLTSALVSLGMAVVFFLGAGSGFVRHKAMVRHRREQPTKVQFSEGVLTEERVGERERVAAVGGVAFRAPLSVSTALVLGRRYRLYYVKPGAFELTVLRELIAVVPA